MPACQWHKFRTSQVAAPPGVLFELLADMPNLTTAAGCPAPGSPAGPPTSSPTRSAGQPLITTGKEACRIQAADQAGSA